ncbi:dihydropyrimidinase [Cognatishimia sp. F0-27]|uniref:dihydropyrimidinase n=1 Tax=Cognatishimia sp. F0-27 TaxID=2816855 RepID=UPI001D0C43EB|nr:dihydropyrimidinase [Cognatishimia sp. F0-27]MCC1493281.1 dihydropyrimidinase [Cognatishimia sp. F0-27]
MTETLDMAIRGGRIVTPEGIVTGDLGIRDGKIVALGAVGTIAVTEIAAQGRWVMPGGVDTHAHIEQMSGMGLWNADTFETATRSAAMGGTTTVISFAAQASGQSLGDAVADYTARAQRGAMIDHAFHITITDTSVAEFEADLARLIASGHRSLKVFTTYNIQLDDADLLRVLGAARAHGALMCVHAENDAIIAHARAALIAEGRLSPRDHARSRPREAEIEAVTRLCHFAEYLDQPIMLFHISTAEAVAVIRAAQARRVPVWAETCPHYLLMTEDILDQPGMAGAKWMCSPPQRTRADQGALWQALSDGVLHLVSSDHAPYRFDETGKLAAGPTPGFPEIANGLPGLETRLPVLFDAMVSRPGGAGPEAFAALTATQPAAIYGLSGKGAIAPGMDADLVIWDPDREVRYGPNDLHDNVGYNPWEGRTVVGWPAQVILRGETIMAEGAFHGRPGQGRWVPRAEAPARPQPPEARA